MSTFYADETLPAGDVPDGQVQAIWTRRGRVWVRWVTLQIGDAEPRRVPMLIAPFLHHLDGLHRHRAPETPLSWWRRMRARWSAICAEGDDMIERDT